MRLRLRALGLLLNVRKKLNQAGGTIGKIFGQDKRARVQRRFGLAQRARRVRRRGKPPKQKNITTYNLARMNMLLHGVKDTATVAIEQAIQAATVKHNAFL